MVIQALTDPPSCGPRPTQTPSHIGTSTETSSIPGLRQQDEPVTASSEVLGSSETRSLHLYDVN